MDKYCQNCNQQNAPDALFCRQCASPLPPGGQSAGTNQGQSANRQGNQQSYTPRTDFAPRTDSFAPDKASGRAIAAVVLAVCGLLCLGPLTAIPGAILGWMEVSAIKDGRSSPKGMTMAQIGLWGGIVISVLGGLMLLIFLAALVSGGMNNNGY